MVSAGVAADLLDNAQKLAAKGQWRDMFEVGTSLSLNQSPAPHLSTVANAQILTMNPLSSISK
jgi:hypothetical protein